MACIYTEHDTAPVAEIHVDALEHGLPSVTDEPRERAESLDQIMLPCQRRLSCDTS